MDVTLCGERRSRLRAELLAHRARSHLTDADYARDVLKVSLNTFKKCVAEDDELTLRRRTLVAVVSATGIDPRLIGSETAPSPGTPLGGYTKADFGYLTGRYFLHRRDFKNGVDITRAVLEITWNEAASCLSFVEMRRHETPGGTYKANDFHGNIHIHQERVLMGLLAIDQGDTRLTLLHIPSRGGYLTGQGTLRASGVVLTHGFPKRYFQPVVSPVTIEAVPPSQRGISPNLLCRAYTPDMPEHAALEEELRTAEEHAIVSTSLMARAAAR